MTKPKLQSLELVSGGFDTSTSSARALSHWVSTNDRPLSGVEGEGNVPELRFSGFTEPWVEKRLGEVTSFINGKAHENEICADGQYIVVNSKYISTDGRVIKKTNSQISPIYRNDLVMVMSDVPNGKALAKCLHIKQSDTYTLNQRICALREKNSSNQFLFFQINRNKYFLAFDNGVGQTNLRKNEVLNCPVNIPSLPEQQKIADFLTSIDTKIIQVDQQIEKMNQFKKGLLQQMFLASTLRQAQCPELSHQQTNPERSRRESE